MEKSLVRVFDIETTPDAFLAVASRPLLAPDYLNFLTSIEPVANALQGEEAKAWQAFQIKLNYRSIVQTTAIVTYRVDTTAKTVFLGHDGPLAAFQSSFEVTEIQVMLDCTYTSKVTLIS
jgi:hypothetical protein